jgi:hypothetical protein
VPWQRIGELLPVRITETELIVYGVDVKEIARHELYPSGVTGQRHSLPQHAPARDHQQKRELLRQRFEDFECDGIQFFDGLLSARRNGKDEAGRVPGLLAVYRREDLTRALERAVHYRAFSWSAVERIPGGAGQAALSKGSAGHRSAGTAQRGPSLHGHQACACIQERRFR